ncbi:MAG: ATP-binding cassette domain-containing protein [Cyanobacteria bacterium P01_F01_bin.150]
MSSSILRQFTSTSSISSLPGSYIPTFRKQLLLSFAQRYPIRAALTVFLGFSGALFNGVGTILVVPVVLKILNQSVEAKAMPALLRALLAPFDSVPEQYRLGVMTLAIVLAIGLKNATVYANSLMSGSLKRKLTSDLREQGLQMLLHVDLDFYNKTGVGDILNRMNAEIGRTTGALRALLKITGAAITIAIFIYLLVNLSPILTIAAAILLSFVAVINQYFIRRSKGFGRLLSQMSRDYSTRLTESVTGIRLIKEAVSEHKEYDVLSRLINKREQLDFQSQANFAAIAPINEMVGILFLLAIVFLGRIFLAEQIDDISTLLLTYLVLLFKLLPIISQLNGARSQFANCSASLDVVQHFLRRDNKPFMKNGTQKFTGFQHSIAFEQVTFAYVGAKDESLRSINLTIPKGQTLALVGASGAGKSTLADLLPRFYEPTKGRITVDGQDLKEFEMRSLRQSMGIVSQEAFLFNDTIRNNVAYARPGASEEDVIDALKRANAYEFILDMPQGLETPIGDRGVLLSGGQRQRLAIARALLKDAEILILDEATSALDTASERLVQEAIDALSRDRTSLVIAHRLSTIQNADQIAVMKHGEVVELGTHAQLLDLDGYYSRLYALQFSDQKPVADAEAEKHRLYKETLVSTSHAIRDRLNSMLGSLNMILEDLVDSPEEEQEMLMESYESATDLLHLLEHLERNH